MSVDGSILGRVAAYYAGKLAAHGTTPQGVDWNSGTSHELRHRQFLRLLEGFTGASVLDLGCGYGDFFRFLRAAGYRGLFVGYDIAPSMIAAAVALHGEDAEHYWRVGATPEETVDFAVASGIFNVKGSSSNENWTAYVRQTIDTLSRVSRQGFAFNVLSRSSDPDRRRPDLYYADPADMLGYCLHRFGRSAALLQDYGLYEFTVIVRQA